MSLLLHILLHFLARHLVLTEPGIRHRNEDSHGNENGNSRKQIFSVEKITTSIFFFLQSVSVDKLNVQN